ncbi:RsmB/NOP family class I SAM-dependent RNA methyltransferase [Sphingomonas aerophila]|uniref:16S rRNA (Cytosine967-C5)-methyltransferase n=1 Tax=Sphingomonas aerophila TaxID=1344948 RepID=A0A7W9EU05_9SPHN|nr:RsmB/NOP family class I SAM-dependent RNA methyltransferase [Sphingomonas aerophila]MBB5714650.1 16S rRNA (cytosine967-C5)-methyltransferase [Sphingomonas aerophila]
MTPAARTEAAIELLDGIISSAREGGAAADTLIARYFAQRRYAGSKDRRAVRELVYAAIRRAGEVPVTGRAALLALAREDAALADTFDGSHHGPAPIDAAEPVAPAGVAPAWLTEALTASGLNAEQQAALIERAPLDVRVNRLRAEPAQIVAELPDAFPVAGAPDALRLPAGTDVARLAGLVEIQDVGSQIVASVVPASANTRVLDLCAGAGGKSLALAAMMANSGHILATDTDRARLSRLPARAEQAGATIIETRLLNPGREAEALGGEAGRIDAVLIDAPCSGTGTWRRNPEARWRLTPARLERLVATQAYLMSLAAPLVRPGGTLTYVTCSLLDAEGTDQVDAFLADHADWSVDALDLPLGRARGHGWRLDPASDSTDGFFVARLRAPW